MNTNNACRRLALLSRMLSWTFRFPVTQFGAGENYHNLCLWMFLKYVSSSLLRARCGNWVSIGNFRAVLIRVGLELVQSVSTIGFTFFTHVNMDNSTQNGE